MKCRIKLTLKIEEKGEKAEQITQESITRKLLLKKVLQIPLLFRSCVFFFKKKYFYLYK